MHLQMHKPTSKVDWTIVLGSVVLFAAVAVQPVAGAGELTRDPAATLGGPWYTGVISTLGIVGWTVAATLFLTAAATGFVGGSQERVAYSYAYAAALSTGLLLDDMLQFHEELAPRLIGSELPVYLVYAVLALAWLSRAPLTPRTRTTLGTSGLLLALSILIDVVWTSSSTARLVTEDGAKFAGIWLWVWVSAQCLATEFRSTIRAAHAQRLDRRV